MEKKISTYTNLLYYLLVAVVLVSLIWAYFLPVELSVPGQGYVTFLGEPYAVTASANGKVLGIEVKNAQEVKKGDKVLSVQSLEGQVPVAAPSPGVLLWQRDLIKGDPIHAGERLALIYPASPIGVKVVLPEKDYGRVLPGMPVRVQLSAYPTQTYGVIQGEVKDRVLQRDSSSGREMQVALLIALEKFPNSQIQLSPGLSARVEIITGRTTLLKKLLL